MGRYLQRLAERMRDLVDLTVICFDDAIPMEGVNFVRLPAPRGRFGRYYTSAIRASRVLRRMVPDVVHSHGDDLMLPRGVPLIRTFYGSSLNEARSSRGLRKYNHYLLAVLEQLSARRAFVKLGIAPESRELMGCDAIFPPYFGVDRAPTDPAPEPMVLFVGSYEGRKQGHVVQSAVEALRREGRGIELTVVGPHTDASSWAPWVDHRSGMSDAEVAQLYRRAWVLVSPSAYEGFGIPVLEALDHGIAAIAYPNPGSTYLRSLAEDDAPLILAEGAEFVQALRERIDRGPALSTRERESATELIEQVKRDGSPHRLVDYYHRAVGAR
ncbi:glycosyltransferase [Microbacterium sp. MEC084]|uniref:glycosyltransferase family 4 protein n=1 Tax=Microbacterium sp. MEC084 TaxID=1963027 RepID=UPI00106F59ED|nr:glycosyltransferase family 4 protein [Microbacterium sp. MEC084]MCD1269697.1 glycosyltransferase [Microbacterium sp. MEC084]